MGSRSKMLKLGVCGRGDVELFAQRLREQEAGDSCADDDDMRLGPRWERRGRLIMTNERWLNLFPWFFICRARAESSVYGTSTGDLALLMVLPPSFLSFLRVDFQMLKALNNSWILLYPALRSMAWPGT